MKALGQAPIITANRPQVHSPAAQARVRLPRFRKATPVLMAAPLMCGIATKKARRSFLKLQGWQGRRRLLPSQVSNRRRTAATRRLNNVFHPIPTRREQTGLPGGLGEDPSSAGLFKPIPLFAKIILVLSKFMCEKLCVIKGRKPCSVFRKNNPGIERRADARVQFRARYPCTRP